MADDELAIWLQTLDGQWELCGSDRLRGIQPQGFQASANRRGSDTCRFVLRRDPGGIHPDLSAFTPCDAWIAGQLCWTGEVKETPTQDGDDAQITVEGQGAQYDLDVDQYERAYVHTRLSDYVDARSKLACDLTAHIVSGKVEASNGAIVLAWDQGANLTGGDNRVGVTLDLGPDSTAKRIVIEWESSNNSSVTFFARGSDSEASTVAPVDDAFTFALTTGASGTSRGTFATARRYIHLFILYNGAAGTASANIWLKLKSVKVFRDTAYESGDASILKADTVIKDALNTATVRTSRDQSQIQAGTFSIPDLVLDGAKTPGEVADAVNAYEGYVWMIDVDRRPVFEPKPTAPLFEVGNWSGADFKDASANSGENIANKVRVEAEGPDGSKQRLDRYRAQIAPVVDVETVSSPAFSNPGFEVDVSGWTTSPAGEIVRDTGVAGHGLPQSGVGFGYWTPSVNGATLTTTLTGTFRRGVAYVVDFYTVNPGFVGPTQAVAVATLGVPGSSASLTVMLGGWTANRLVWIPLADQTGVTFTLRRTHPTLTSYGLDTLSIGVGRGSLPERRGFTKGKTLPVGAAMTPGGMQRIADIWLAEHQTTPLKGDVEIVGQGGVRRVLGGQAMHPGHLLRYPNELLRLSHRIDPNTGGQGRDGEIAAVAYDHDARKAAVSIDDERGNTEKLLARYAVVVGG